MQLGTGLESRHKGIDTTTGAPDVLFDVGVENGPLQPRRKHYEEITKFYKNLSYRTTESISNAKASYDSLGTKTMLYLDALAHIAGYGLTLIAKPGLLAFTRAIAQFQTSNSRVEQTWLFFLAMLTLIISFLLVPCILIGMGLIKGVRKDKPKNTLVAFANAN